MLHNIKLLIAFIHTFNHEYLMNIFALINFAACRQNPELKEWVMIDHD